MKGPRGTAIITSMRRSSRAFFGKRWLFAPLLLGVSLLGTGFAAWELSGVPSSLHVPEAEFAGTKPSYVNLSSIGFQALPDSLVEPEWIGEAGEREFVGDPVLSVEATVDMNLFGNVFYNDGFYLKVVVQRIAASALPAIEELSLSPSRYPWFAFPAMRGGEGSRDFYFPLKSQVRTSLFLLGSLDANAPEEGESAKNPNVGIRFSFPLKEDMAETFLSGNLPSLSFSFSLTENLPEEAV